MISGAPTATEMIKLERPFLLEPGFFFPMLFTPFLLPLLLVRHTSSALERSSSRRRTKLRRSSRRPERSAGNSLGKGKNGKA